VKWLHHVDGDAYREAKARLEDRLGMPVEAGTILEVGDGSVLFHRWQKDEGTIEITAAGSGPWRSRAAVRDMAEFVFGQLGCQVLVARIDNPALRRAMERRGFTAHVVPRLRGRNKAETIMILTEENARSLRVLEVRHGRKAA
jgi:hypothetical protein